MSAPKLQRIVNAVAARAAVITTANGYYSNIGNNLLRDRREAHESEVPAMMVYLGERIPAETSSKRARCEQTITVAGYRLLDGDAEQIGIEMLSDIQTAIELEDSTLSGLLQGSQYGLTWQGDEIYMPEVGENVVGVRVTYAIPHIRKSGDPEIT